MWQFSSCLFVNRYTSFAIASFPNKLIHLVGIFCNFKSSFFLTQLFCANWVVTIFFFNSANNILLPENSSGWPRRNNCRYFNSKTWQLPELKHSSFLIKKGIITKSTFLNFYRQRFLSWLNNAVLEKTFTHP